MAFKDIEAFEKYLEAIDELYDEGSTMIKEAHILIETDRKILNKVKRSKYGKGTNNTDKKITRYEGKNCFKPPGAINCFFRCILFLCLKDKIDYFKTSNKEDYINFITQGTLLCEEMTLCKIHKFCENFILPYGYFSSKEILPNEASITTKKL